jgi:hypothetical protein
METTLVVHDRPDVAPDATAAARVAGGSAPAADLRRQLRSVAPHLGRSRSLGSIVGWATCNWALQLAAPWTIFLWLPVVAAPPLALPHLRRDRRISIPLNAGSRYAQSADDRRPLQQWVSP